MKHLALLYLLGLVFIYSGILELSDYTLSVESPPGNGLPDLFYDKQGHPIPAQREILESKDSERNLVYKFYLPSGTYHRLSWTGHGAVLPPTLSICDYWNRPIAILKSPDAASVDLLAPPNGPLSLPLPGILSVAKWLLKTTWGLLFFAFLCLMLQEPLATRIGRFLELPAERFRLGPINGKIMLLTIVCLGAVWLSLIVPGAIRFEVGDDPAMEMLASGYVTGHPSEYLVFINVLIGLFLKSLYLVAPQMPWYPLLLLAVIIFCLTGITSLLLRDELSDRFCWLCLFGTVFGTYFVTHLQFTPAACLLALFGMLVFSQETSRFSLMPAVALVVMGSLIRFDSFLLVLVTTAGAAWLLSRRNVSDKVLFLAAVIFLSWAGKAFDHAYYDRDAGWRAYRQYNTWRGDLHMTPKLNFSAKNKPFYDHVGWSENDLKMFNSHWLYEDTAAFSADKLAYLDAHLSSDRQSVDVLINLLAAIALSLAPVLLFLAILCHKRENRELTLFKLAVIIGPMLFVLGYLAITTRLPARVVVPSLYASSLFLLLATRENGTTCRALSSMYALPLLFITLTFFSVGSMWINAEQNERLTKRLTISLKYLTPYSDKTFVDSINSVRLEQLAPLTALAEIQKINIIQLMWSGGSPSFELQLQRHGSASLFQSIAFDPNFWLLIPTFQWERAESFQLYMQKYYHQNIQLTPVVLSDGKPAVFPDFTVMQVKHDGQP